MELNLVHGYQIPLGVGRISVRGADSFRDWVSDMEPGKIFAKGESLVLFEGKREITFEMDMSPGLITVR